MTLEEKKKHLRNNFWTMLLDMRFHAEYGNTAIVKSIDGYITNQLVIERCQNILSDDECDLIERISAAILFGVM